MKISKFKAYCLNNPYDNNSLEKLNKLNRFKEKEIEASAEFALKAKKFIEKIEIYDKKIENAKRKIKINQRG